MTTNGISQHVPIVNFGPIVSNSDEGSRKKAIQDFADAIKINGCVGIRDYGTSPQFIKDVFGMTKRLFDLPHDEKMKAPHPKGGSPHRGYSPIGQEQSGASGATRTEDEERKAELNRLKDYKVQWPTAIFPDLINCVLTRCSALAK